MAAIAAAAAAATVGSGVHVPASLGLLGGASHSTSAGLPDTGAIAAAAAAAGSAGLHPMALPPGHHKHVFQAAYPLQVDGLLNTDGSVVESADLSPKVRCPECKAGFMRATTMREHVAARHASVKPFRCETCGRGFTEKGHLSLHERSVHNNERPHACELCGRSFSTGSNKRTHFRVVHPIVLPAPGQEALYHAERKDEERRLKADSKGKLGRTKQARNQGDHRSAGLPMPPADACECARALVEGRDSVLDSDGNQRRIGNFLCVTCGGAFGSLGTVRTHSKRDHGIEIPVASAATSSKQRKRSRSASRDAHHSDLVPMELDTAHAAAAAAAAAAVSGMHQHIPLNLDEAALGVVPNLPPTHFRGMEGGSLAQAAMAAASAAASSVVGPAPKRLRDAGGMDPAAMALAHSGAQPMGSDPSDVAHITAAALSGNGSSLQSLLSELSSQHAGHSLGVGLDHGLVPGFPAHGGTQGTSLMAVIAALQHRPDPNGFGSAAEAAAAVSSGLSSGMNGSFTPGGAP